MIIKVLPEITPTHVLLAGYYGGRRSNTDRRVMYSLYIHHTTNSILTEVKTSVIHLVPVFADGAGKKLKIKKSKKRKNKVKVQPRF